MNEEERVSRQQAGEMNAIRCFKPGEMRLDNTREVLPDGFSVAVRPDRISPIRNGVRYVTFTDDQVHWLALVCGGYVEDQEQKTEEPVTDPE